MSKPMTQTADEVRYHWMVAKRPPVFVPGYLIGRLLVEPLFARRGMTVSPEGIKLHKIFSTRSLSWAEVQAVSTEDSRAHGRHRPPAGVR